LAVLVMLLAPGTSYAQDCPSIPIDHFIYIIQENHTYDSYFGTYPAPNGIPIATKPSYYPGGPPEVAPFHLRATHIPHDLSHSWQAARTAWDNGRMDGFLRAEWPKALQYYWDDKPVPQPDPRLVHPVPTPTPAAIAAGETEPGDQPDANEPDPNDPTPPQGPPPSWVLNTLAYMDWHEI
jgi:hypothetical protein